MADLSPELADKVLSADLRNLIKKVGAGGTLSASERQMFLSITGQGESDELAATRVNALLNKWINGARLNDGELEEIQHVLPSPETERQYKGTADEAAANMGLSRRAFFRWTGAGKKHNDPLPCDNLTAVPAWYKRMQDRGEFRNKMPAAVKAAIGKAPRAATTKPPAGAADPDQSEEPPKSSSAGLMREVMAGDHGPLGLHVEIEDMERRAAHFRQAMVLAYNRGNDDEGDRMSERHGDLVEKIRRLKKDRKITEDDEDFTRKAWVREDLGQIIPAIVTSLEFMGAELFGRIKCDLTRAEFLALHRELLAKSFSGLRQSKFAPPLQLSA